MTNKTILSMREAIQLLEEMGLDKTSMCPYCNEILISRVKKITSRDGKQTIYRCTSCAQTFKVMTCRLCNHKRYSHKLGICVKCFKKARIPRLVQEANKLSREYKKVILIRSRKKPDISFMIPKILYNSIALRSIDEKTSKSSLIKKMLEGYFKKS